MPIKAARLLRRINALRPLVMMAAVFGSFPAQASEAVVVELYRDCELADTTVLIDQGALSPAQSAEVKARAAAAANEDLRAALPRIIRILRRHGIDDVEITRQGFKDCKPQVSGKYVEAVGTYCGARLERAELIVDRKTMMSRSEPDMTFEAFLREAVAALRDRGIYDRPMVAIENAPGCGGSS